MPFLDRIPRVERCCGCVTDLKTAAAIIAVLGIVTSPIVSWVIVRHAYVIRVTCVVTTNSSQPDVVDISLNNALSFGFGANAGIGPSCLSRNITDETGAVKPQSGFIQFVRYSGWIILLADVAFLVSSINFLVKMFKGRDYKASLYFMVTGLISVTLSCTYGILYVTTCIFVGGGFPVYEFFFAGVDMITWFMWLHFILVVDSYYLTSPTGENNEFGRDFVWVYYLIVVFSYRRNAT